MKFKIKKGNHYPNLTFPRICFSKVLEGTFILEGDFSYQIPKQYDTNKLIGLSDGWHHHSNSIRLGFRWNRDNNSTQLMIIRYLNGERFIEPIDYIQSNTLYYFRIEVRKTHYLVTVNSQTFTLLRESKWFLPRILLKPFFGGTTPAPKNFNFNINLI